MIIMLSTGLYKSPVDPRRNSYFRRLNNAQVAQGLIKLGSAYVSNQAYNFARNKIFGSNIMPTAKSTRKSLKYTKRRTSRGTTSRKRKGRRGRKTKKTSLKKQVRQIKQQLSADSAKHLFKAINKYNVSCAVNQCNYSEIPISTATYIEAYMANLRYYDPAVPGTLVTASAATGSYQREVHFKNIRSMIEVINNYQVPCRVKVYLLKPKGDTSVVPTTYYNNSAADQVIGGAATITTKGLFPTELNAFKAQWSIKCVKDVYLDAGARVIASHNTGAFKYDPSLFDTHALEYQPKFKTASWLIRIEGAYSHDTAAAERTTGLAQVDIDERAQASIEYDAGINLDDIYISNAHSASFTNGGVVTNKPIADNQSYSVS